VVIEERDEVGDGALEVNVVLPQGVVGVDEEVLAGRDAMGHGSILMAARTKIPTQAKMLGWGRPVFREWEETAGPSTRYARSG
jgi:hypothetical protein